MQHAFRMNISTLDMMKILVSLRYQMDSNGNSYIKYISIFVPTVMEEENHPFGENELIFVHFPFRPFFQLHAYGRKSISRFAPMSLHRVFKVRRGGKGPGSTWQYSSSNISKQEVRYYKGFPFLTSELDSIHTSISPFSESRSVSNFPARLHTDSNMKSTGNAVNKPGQHVFTLGFRNEPSDVYSEIRQ